MEVVGLPSLKRTAKAPENGPKPIMKLIFQSYPTIHFQVLCWETTRCGIFLYLEDHPMTGTWLITMVMVIPLKHPKKVDALEGFAPQ